MLDKTKTYMVLNYDTSPVAIKTRDHNELIPAGNDMNPNGLPLTIDEISYINSTTKVFKIGRLFFEPEYEAEIYDELRIRDWQNILRNQDIYDIILNPTIESLERILNIDDQMYFSRIYGAFVGLQNAGVSISSNVENVIKARYAELVKHKRKTAIKLRPKELEQTVANDQKTEALEKEVAEMRAMIAQLMAEKNATNVPSEPIEAKPVSEDKPKSTTRKRSSKPATEKTE